MLCVLRLFYYLGFVLEAFGRRPQADLSNEVGLKITGPSDRFSPAGAGFLVENDLSHDFFARSPSIYTILPPL